MKRIVNLDALKIGDKVLRVEYNQGLGGQVERVYANLVTVTKITKAKVYFNDDVYNSGFAVRKDTYNPDGNFYYGKKTDYYIPTVAEIQSGSLMLQ